MAVIATDILLPDFRSPAAARHRRWRGIKDRIAGWIMAVGGISVILAIVLIAFYLVYVVLPLFRPAHVAQTTEFVLPGGTDSATLHYALEEQREIGMRVTAAGEVIFFATQDGAIVERKPLTGSVPASITAFSAGDPAGGLLVVGMSNGSAVLARHAYDVSYPNDIRLIKPRLDFPLGREPIPVDSASQPLRVISAGSDDKQTTIAAATGESRVWLVSLTRKRKSLASKEVETVRTRTKLSLEYPATHLAVDVDQQELYAADTQGTLYYYDISNKSDPRLVERVAAVADGVRITTLAFLSGGISILVGDSSGQVAQWFPVRDDENNYSLKKVRSFDSQSSPITALVPEYFRKGFLAADAGGRLGVYHSTAERTLALEQIAGGAVSQMAIAPRADAVLVERPGGRLSVLDVENEHPEVSWRSLWGKVWYESRQQPEYIWQSSSASSDFEPKFSLTPLAFGTFKAALYASLFAVPLAIMGAIYTAYFMEARMRNLVKPTIEIMAALPSVILGFLAGLWFAPFVENHLPGIFLILLSIPLSILAFGILWEVLPQRVRQRVPEGSEAILLIPVLVAAFALAIALSQPVEVMFFNGNMPLWLSQEMGITYDQRNSLVVGFAIGFAVIPTIFSISEDAIFGVPKHLTTGSLALGATLWQTMVRVVLLTASPGIFSAVMIGLGRAVGETMIVVMATGNTAVMDINIFQGFRALSANIAVEMPESEVGSTHYRILFLAGLVLFLATFMFNTVAEVVRQRLRAKYSNL
ncbi:MAG: phosphate ABC transporter permease [Gammaproteobacteria bacterium RIFCSPLOWO2_02_FULL_61_13]|nr:MAG: phosphate ABC transporter permease [Gammaproteobacteria bacterium RIFCSPLOWO2_02_FULL_61_13]